MCDSVPKSKTSLTYALSTNAKAWGYAGIALSQAVMCMTFQQLPAETLLLGNTFDRMSKTTAKRAVSVMQKALVAAASCECEGNSGVLSNTAIALAHLASTSAVVGGNLLLPDSVRSLASMSVDDMGDEEKVAEVLAGSEAFLEHIACNVESIEELVHFLDDFAAGTQVKINQARDSILSQSDQSARHKSNLYVNALQAAVQTLRAGAQALKDAKAHVYSVDEAALKAGSIQTLNAQDVVDPITFDHTAVNVRALGFRDSDGPAQYWAQIQQSMDTFVELINVNVRASLFITAYRQVINRTSVMIDFGEPADSQDPFFRNVQNVGYTNLQAMLDHMSNVSQALRGELSTHLLHELDREAEYAVDVLQRQDYARKQNAVVQADRLLHSAEVQVQETGRLVDRQEDILADVNTVSRDVQLTDPWHAKVVPDLVSNTDRFILQYTLDNPLSEFATGKPLDTTAKAGHPVIQLMDRTIKEDLQLSSYPTSSDLLGDSISRIEGDLIRLQGLNMEKQVALAAEQARDEQGKVVFAQRKRVEADDKVAAAQRAIQASVDKRALFSAQIGTIGEVSEKEKLDMLESDVRYALNSGINVEFEAGPYDEFAIRDVFKTLIEEHNGLNSSKSEEENYVEFWKEKDITDDAQRWNLFKAGIDGGYDVPSTFKLIDTSIQVLFDGANVLQREESQKGFEDDLFKGLTTYNQLVWQVGLKFLEERRSEYLGIKVRVHQARSKAWDAVEGATNQQQARWYAFLDNIAQQKQEAEAHYTYAKQARYQGELQRDRAKDTLQCATRERLQAEASMAVTGNSK